MERLNGQYQAFFFFKLKNLFIEIKKILPILWYAKFGEFFAKKLQENQLNLL